MSNRSFCQLCCLATFLAFFWLWLPVRAQAGQAVSQQIIASDNRGITIAFTVEHWLADTISTKNKPMQRLDFADAVFIEKIGQPQIPYHVAVIAVPVGAVVRYRIIEEVPVVATDVVLLPFPEYSKIDGETVEEYAPAKDVYQSTNIYPAERADLGKPGWLRSQQIVRLALAAARYLPGEKRLIKFNRIVVRLDFAGGVAASTVSQNRSVSEESFYKNIILNYEQAKSWRKEKTRTAALAKRTAQESIFYVMKIREEGVYKLDGRFLESSISGLDLSSIDPKMIRLYNNGGRELPRNIQDNRPDGLVENAIVVNDGGDGRFDRDDFILFYGKGVEGWEYDSVTGEFSHYINHYGFDNHYWLSLDGSQEGKRMNNIASAPTQTSVTQTYQGLFFIEEEDNNPINSGLNWFGRNFANNDLGRTGTWKVDLPNAISTGSSDFRFRFVTLNERIHRFTINVNDTTLGTSQLTGTAANRGIYKIMNVRDFSYQNRSVLIPGTNTIKLTYSHTADFGQAFLDWFEIQYEAGLNAVENALCFSVLPKGGLESYQIAEFSDSQVSVFDVTDYANVVEFTGVDFTSGAASFTRTDSDGAPHRFAAVGTSSYKSISSLERVALVDLRAPDIAAEFIIITHDDFESEANRLESYRENGSPNNRLSTVTVKISDVYNNFSAGMVDPLAIRDFLKHAYDNGTETPLYVLLLGDGDYDFKNRIVRSDLNWIPTFQSDELVDDGSTSIVELVSRTTDSWFAYLTPDDYRTEQNRSPRPIMDLAIGRLTVQTVEEAQDVIDKIIAYESQPFGGNWRNIITMVGDDELIGGGKASAVDVVHINQTETIAETIIPDSYDIRKIYLSEFPKVVSASSGGVKKPAAKEALIGQINQGSLIVIYIGHGNSTVWAHEEVFHQTDNIRVQNQNKLSFFVAATCDWALSDSPKGQSQAEELLLFKERGAIGIISSARLVFSSTNFAFSRAYYRQLFNETGQTNRIGDAFVQARLANMARVNDEKYHVYGDPTLRLAAPELRAEITSVTPDSILALSTMEIEGEVGQNGQISSDFNGTALVTAYDSKRKVEHLTEVGSTQTYMLPGNSIYRGTVQVQNGKFKARFVVPKDVSYGGKLAKISSYFWNEASDGIGYKDHIPVSSSSLNIVDTEGPEIKVFFKESLNFTTGDIIGEKVTMVVELADTVSGINIAGEIGHRLTLTIDPDEETCLSQLNQFKGIGAIDLTDLFRFNEGDHLRGSIEFPIEFPEEVEIGGIVASCLPSDGEQKHNLVIKTWDNSNNSSTASVEVRIAHGEGLILREVMNYPNPFTNKTTFTFFTNQDSEVVIKIYTVSGQLIKTLEYHNAGNGFNMVEWNGLDEQGDFPANGVYLYKLIAKSLSSDGPIQSETLGRLAIIR